MNCRSPSSLAARSSSSASSSLEQPVRRAGSPWRRPGWALAASVGGVDLAVESSTSIVGGANASAAALKASSRSVMFDAEQPTAR